MEIHEDLNLERTYADETERDYVALLENFPYRPTLYLGLGGTGALAVWSVKTLFLKLVAPQRKEGQIADVADIDPLYSFLAFDTNVSECPPDLGENDEWYHLAVRDLNRFYRGLGATSFFEEWVVKNFPAGSIMAGASGFRNLGRLALMANISQVQRAIDGKRQQILRAAASPKTKNPRPVVFVFSSLSGGTGSGMLLDTCFLIRSLFGEGTDVVGLVAVLDGLPTVPESKRRDIRVNTFCGLKELNAFMDRKAEGVEFGEAIEYPFNVSGQVREPFDECYLVTSQRADGTTSLPTQSHLTSFMARFSFMMSAFSFRDEGLQTPDYNGIMVNHRAELTKKAAGAKTAYCAPGLAQVHFPVEMVANVFALEAAINYIKYQTSGAADAGVEEARDFLVSNKLDYQSTRNRISIDPRSEKSAVLRPNSYDDVIADLLKHGDRYEKRDELLSFGKKVPGPRLQEIEAILGANVNGLVDSIWPDVLNRFSELLVKPESLALGAVDFLEDLSDLIAQERDYLAAESKKRIDRVYDSLEAQWKQIEQVVADVVTDDGLPDRIMDGFRVRTAQALYISFLNEAEQVILEKARNELTREFFTRLLEDLDSLKARTNRLLKEDLPAAIKHISERSRQLQTKLHDQVEGTDPTVENICSLNVMTQAWREAYFAKRGLTPQTILSNLLESGWHPRKLLEEKPPEGKELTRFLGQTIISLVSPLLDRERRWTPMDVLHETEEFRGAEPQEIIAKIYDKALQPQLQTTSMGTLLGGNTYELIFCGGINEDLRDALTRTDAFQGKVLSVANNQEANRINFFCTGLPMAMAGCDSLHDTFEPAYERWASQVQQLSHKEQEYERSLYHCFPKSYQWPSPTRFHHEHEETKVLFSRALCISEMMEPCAADSEKMLSQSKNPKEQRYALFQYGKSQFWIWPFFEPNNPASPIEGKVKRLGPNVLDAYVALMRNDQYKQWATSWVNWFQEKWGATLTGPQAEKGRQDATKTFQARKGTSTDPRWIELWDDFIKIVLDWKEVG